MIDLPYAAIGWDFDGVLIDHPKSSLFHEFIIANPKRRHVILTFRSHGWQRRIFTEMRRKYPDAPGPECFSDVRNISDEAWERFNDIEHRRLTGMIEGPPTIWEDYYVEWKGMTCYQLGVLVMIDDRPEQVVPGCDKYGITYRHPDEL